MHKRFLLLLLFFSMMHIAFSQTWEELDIKFKEHFTSKNYKASVLIANKQLLLVEGKYSNKHAFYKKTLNNLAIINVAQENYEEALKYYNEELKFELSRLEQLFPTFGSSLNTTVSGMFIPLETGEVATEAYRKTVALLEKTDTVDYSVFTKITNVYTNSVQKQYGLAPQTDKQSIENVKTKYGVQSDEYLTLLDSLGSIYKQYGRFNQALEIFLEVYGLRKEGNKTNTIEHAKACLGIAYIHIMLQKYNKAESYFKQGVAIWKKEGYKVDKEYVTALYYYSLPSQIAQNYPKAVEILTEAALLSEKKLHSDFFLYPTIILSLASMHGVSKNYKESLHYFDKYHKRIKNKKGDNSGELMSYYASIRLLYERMNRLDDAEDMYVKFNQISTKLLNDMSKYFSFSDEKRLTQSFLSFKYSLDQFYSFCFKRITASPQLAEEMYNDELIKKGLILRTIKSKVAQVINSGDIVYINIFNKWVKQRQKLAKLYQLPISERVENIMSVEKRTQQLENKMAAKNYLNSKANKIITWKMVQEKLSADEVAIEFVHVAYSDVLKGKFKDSIVYGALILRSGYAHPKFVFLFNAKEFEQFFNQNNAKGDYAKVNQLYAWPNGKNRQTKKGDSLYHFIWEPITPLLQNVKRIYYSPSGLLHKIAFPVIPVNEKESLIDKYDMHLMSTTGNLTAGKKSLQASKDFKALLYGGIFYDLTPDSINTFVKKHNPADMDWFIHDRSFAWSDSLRNGYSWSYLGGTLKEVLHIEQLLKEYQMTTKVLSKDEAIEESLKYMEKNQPDIIHIATHGFFFPEKKAERKKEGFASMNLIMNPSSNTDDILLRSGLLFAGAQNSWQGDTFPTGIEDGILTAYEVSKLYLANTKLVVLSACETGLGDIRGGEGVYGLQRAFQLAGAEYVIMSLWQIPDEQTAELMKHFYSNWLGGQDIHQAFNNAQKEMSKKYDPYFWAAFVLVD